ncbi:MAG: TonB-dependent receptor [Pseudomonadota bacterium]|nr:TonB-dependent receptor [Pseudomonadota bacterium]
MLSRVFPFRTIAACAPAVGFALTFAFVSARPAEAADGAPPAPAAEVETIVVTSEKLTVETLIDRKVYSVASDMQSSFGSLSDILGIIPSVDVDPDGLVSLRGDSNVLILIDGKPSTQFSGPSAGDNLQSIPAKDIERIEILTTPPAQFKADGAAGVINIITRKRRPQGLAGSLQGSWGSEGRYVTGASGSYSSGPLAASITAAYRHDIRERMIQSDVKARDPVTSLVSDSNSTINERIRREVPSVGVTAEYALNDRQSITVSLNWANRGGLRTYTELNDIGTQAGVLSASSRRFSSGHDPENDYDQKLVFSQKLGRPDETLDFSLHRSVSKQHEHYDYTNDSFIPPAGTFLNNLDFHEDKSTTEFGADYALPLAKTRSLKLGYAFERDDYRNNNVGNNVDPVTGAQMVDQNLNNYFKFRQQINATYASYQASIGAWDWLGGLRAEHTTTDSQQVTTHISTRGAYFDVYPSLHVNRSLSDESKLVFGASRRVVRPDPDNYNPYVDREYTPNLRAGNPGLKPQFTQSYEVGYGYEGHGLSYGVTGYYRRNRDSVTDVTEYFGNGISLTTKTNLPKSDSAGLEFTSNGRLIAKVNYSISGNLFYGQIDAAALGQSALQSTSGVNAKIKLDYRPTGDDSAQITATRTDKRLTPQGYVSAINLVNLGYKRQLKADLSAVVTASDIFSGQRYQRFARTPIFTQEYRRIARGRIVYVGLVYSFGSSKKDKQGFEYDKPE